MIENGAAGAIGMFFISVIHGHLETAFANSIAPDAAWRHLKLDQFAAGKILWFFRAIEGAEGNI